MHLCSVFVYLCGNVGILPSLLLFLDKIFLIIIPLVFVAAAACSISSDSSMFSSDPLYLQVKKIKVIKHK
jgi:hypothetical protein